MGEAEPRPGDILLLRSPGLLGWAIRFFDGAEVDRAALVLPDGRGAEAVGDSVAVSPLTEIIAGTERVIVRRRVDEGDGFQGPQHAFRTPPESIRAGPLLDQFGPRHDGSVCAGGVGRGHRDHASARLA